MIENLQIYERATMTDGKVLTGKPSIDRPWEKYYSKEVLNYDFPEKNLYQCIYDNNKNHLGRIAIEYYGRKITYKELFKNIDRATKSLKQNGINKGDIVTVCMPTTPETIYLFYALSRIGAIGNMIDPRTSAEGILEYVKEADSKMLVIMDLFYQKAMPSMEHTSIKKVVTISAADSLPMGMKFGYSMSQMMKYFTGRIPYIQSKGMTSKWNDFMEEGKNYTKDIPSEYEVDLPAVIVHTGGTTGSPKGVVLSNDSLNIVAYQYKLSGMHLLPGHKFLDIMPPFIAYGVGCGVHMPLVTGMTVVPFPTFNPKNFDKVLLKVKPNHLAVVPSYIDFLIKSKKLKNKNLSNLITLAVGGDAISSIEKEQEMNKFCEQCNLPNDIIKGYGMTEQTSLASACVNEHNKIGSVGIPLPQNIISVFDENGEELNYDQEGEICIYCPTKMIGYYNNQKETQNVLKKHSDGKAWLHTGDLGHIDRDGYIFISGRMKRVIIRHDGFKVYPFIIEKTILLHPAVKQCMVVGIPDLNHSQGLIPKAHVILKDEYKGKENQVIEELNLLCSQSLPEYVCPHDFKIRDDFPYTSIGKIDFNSLMAEDEIVSKSK